MKEQILNAMEIAKYNFKQWNITKLNEVEAGIITKERYEELAVQSKEMTNAQLDYLEKQLQELS